MTSGENILNFKLVSYLESDHYVNHSNQGMTLQTTKEHNFVRFICFFWNLRNVNISFAQLLLILLQTKKQQRL